MVDFDDLDGSWAEFWPVKRSDPIRSKNCRRLSRTISALPSALTVVSVKTATQCDLELVSFIRSNERYREIPLVIVSTEGSERDRDRGLELGADAYLVKPFDPDALRQVVGDLLSQDR